MSYQVLARKWRPQAFDDVAGQAHVTAPLRNAIRSDRVPHALLLTGPRGVGKTTLARILARCLNCEKGPTDTPCGVCSSCREVIEGHSLDVQEIDAASRTSVDDVRELIQAIRYAPSPGKHRIFVVDEVHMLSTAAFNALLKTLEEPPPRSLFVFCTTNPEKIPFTVISRCQRYDLRRIATREIVERLALIAGDEGFGIEERSLLAIAREADGSMRDAQTLLDQVIAYGGQAIEHDRVAEILDLVDRRILLAVLEACVAGDAAAALQACGRAQEAGIEAKRLGESLLELLRDLVILRIAPQAADQLLEGADEEIEELRALAERSEAARLRRMFRALLKEQEDLAWAPAPMAVLEMAVVRLATQPEGDDVRRLLGRLDALERRLAGGDDEPPASPGSGGGGAPADRPRGRASGGSGRQRAAPAPGSSNGAAQPEPEPAEAQPTSEAAAEAPLEVVYDRLKSFVARRQPALGTALEDAALVERSAGALKLRTAQAFTARRLHDRREALEALGGELFGRPVRVEVELESADSEPGGLDPQTLRRIRQQALEDPGVLAAKEVLQGQVVEIRPLGGGRG